jgi:hypothetical protein
MNSLLGNSPAPLLRLRYLLCDLPTHVRGWQPPDLSPNVQVPGDGTTFHCLREKLSRKVQPRCCSTVKVCISFRVPTSENRHDLLESHNGGCALKAGGGGLHFK